MADISTPPTSSPLFFLPTLSSRGYNYVGMLGDGTYTQRQSPVAVAGGYAYAQISAGGQHTVGLLAA